jgi:glycogen debranching enzyme
VRTAYLWKGAAHQWIAVGNHGKVPVAFTLALTFGNDFADLFEVRGQERQRRGHLQEAVRSNNKVAFIYMGLDRLLRQTELSFDPPPTKLLASAATYQLYAKSGQLLYIYFSAECHGANPPSTSPFSRA